MKSSTRNICYYVGTALAIITCLITWPLLNNKIKLEILDDEEFIEEIFDDTLDNMMEEIQEMDEGHKVLDIKTETTKGYYTHYFSHHFLSINSDENDEVWNAKDKIYREKNKDLLKEQKIHLKSRGYSEEDIEKEFKQNFVKEWCKTNTNKNYGSIFGLKYDESTYMAELWEHCSKWKTKPKTLKKRGHFVAIRGNSKWWETQAIAVFGTGEDDAEGLGFNASKNSKFAQIYQKYKGQGKSQEAKKKLKKACNYASSKISAVRNEDALRFCTLMGYFPNVDENPFGTHKRTLGDSRDSSISGSFGSAFKYHFLSQQGINNARLWQTRNRQYQGDRKAEKDKLSSSVKAKCKQDLKIKHNQLQAHKSPGDNLINFLWSTCSIGGFLPATHQDKQGHLVKTTGNDIWWEQQTRTVFETNKREGTGSKAKVGSKFAALYKKYKGKGDEDLAMHALKEACDESYKQVKPGEDPDTLRFCSLIGYFPEESLFL